jgi:hypothetical protein
MNGEAQEERPPRESGAREEEVLIPDSRAQLTPAQIVESKLVVLLNGRGVPISSLQQSLQRRPR